ncbi:hypothetical protein [Limnochorda pilosa]|uniref:Carboxypeptidase regulatory-like domain-containing protein n=1 Tax=Limnochorda pilosa TaxID=1555112 RepID=A0A0K2SQI2_LIMPI|nr:hypothetical protein [Limnochorda pilosa]BAS29361.1 hypothetical protein LIP_3550 [Limnochorda pilosa]
MQNWLPWIIGLAVAALIVVPMATYNPPTETGVVLTGRVIEASGEPLRARVEAWQAWEHSYGSPVNYWKIPNWRMPVATTDAGGYFRLEDLIDYPEMKSHEYYIVIAPDRPGYAHTGYYLDLTKHQEGEVIDWGTIAVNRDASSGR